MLNSYKIYYPDDVHQIVSKHKKKKIKRKANDVRQAMEKNGEILIEGRIPSEYVKKIS